MLLCRLFSRPKTKLLILTLAIWGFYPDSNYWLCSTYPVDMWYFEIREQLLDDVFSLVGHETNY